MEVKINREIREYTESMFFGLNLRQFVCSVLACASAVGLYFWLKPRVGTEIVSWACILGALPFAVLGFLTYNGMKAEELIGAVIRTWIIGRKPLVFRSENKWVSVTEPITQRYIKESMKKHGKDLKQCE